MHWWSVILRYVLRFAGYGIVGMTCGGFFHACVMFFGAGMHIEGTGGVFVGNCV